VFFGLVAFVNGNATLQENRSLLEEDLIKFCIENLTTESTRTEKLKTGLRRMLNKIPPPRISYCAGVFKIGESKTESTVEEGDVLERESVIIPTVRDGDVLNIKTDLNPNTFGDLLTCLFLLRGEEHNIDEEQKNKEEAQKALKDLITEVFQSQYSENEIKEKEILSKIEACMPVKETLGKVASELTFSPEWKQGKGLVSLLRNIVLIPKVESLEASELVSHARTFADDTSADSCLYPHKTTNDIVADEDNGDDSDL